MSNSISFKASSDPPSRFRPLRILVVDDNREAAVSIKEALEENGDTVSICFDGQSAVKMTVSEVPEVLLLDLAMPGMSGEEVAKVLRDNPALMRLKIIAITGFGDATARQKTADAGFDLHLTKPVRLDVLVDMLDLLRAAPCGPS